MGFAWNLSGWTREQLGILGTMKIFTGLLTQRARSPAKEMYAILHKTILFDGVFDYHSHICEKTTTWEFSWGNTEHPESPFNHGALKSFSFLFC